MNDKQKEDGGCAGLILIWAIIVTVMSIIIFSCSHPTESHKVTVDTTTVVERPATADVRTIIINEDWHAALVDGRLVVEYSDSAQDMSNQNRALLTEIVTFYGGYNYVKDQPDYTPPQLDTAVPGLNF